MICVSFKRAEPRWLSSFKPQDVWPMIKLPDCRMRRGRESGCAQSQCSRKGGVDFSSFYRATITNESKVPYIT